MVPSPKYLWTAAFMVWVGVVGTTGVIPQRRLSLVAPLNTVVPSTLDGYLGTDVEISQEEQRAAGFTDYLMRSYDLMKSSDAPGAGGDQAAAGSPLPWFTVYVGYYAGQTHGETIHSPKNCLPGAGWEALASEVATIETSGGPVRVNRYLLQNGNQQALVLYWYQGRGRVQASEYMVKWDLLRDAALLQRSDEALVRIVVPNPGAEADSFGLARSVAERLIPALNQALPS
ncbi:MAG TPA: EpsI family protein [Longimicrobiales bacterium]|nr:EpsI family protein [Longimicrobiales bacterium]